MNASPSCPADGVRFRKPRAVSGLRADANALLALPGCRLGFTAGVAVCASGAVTVLVFLRYAVMIALRTESSDYVWYALDTAAAALSFLCAFPLFFGCRRMADGVAGTGECDLRRLFSAFSAPCSFGRALAAEALYSLSYLPPLFAWDFTAVFFGYDWALLPLLFWPLWLRLTALFRRMCRLFAADPEAGLREAFRRARRTDRCLRKTRTALALSYTGEWILTALTLLIFGLYRTFGAVLLASACQTREELNAAVRLTKNKPLSERIQK